MPPPFFCLLFLGLPAWVVSWCFASSACCPGGRLLALMASFSVFVTVSMFSFRF